MAHFTQKLVLSRWILEQFGVETLETFKGLLADPNLVGFDEENNSLFHYELINKPFRQRAMPDDTLRRYDDNIVRHWRRITERRNHSGNTLYPLYFQYLVLLFTEHYLDRYFTDRTALCTDLNTFRAAFNVDLKLSEREEIQPFNEADLNKLAIWIATGGGKTLIMHVNILQFQHYLKQHQRDRDFNRTILLTPNEGLSLQHKIELDLAGIEGDLFIKDGGGLLTQGAVEIIDIHKLREKSGDVTVAVEAFESNNLVLVDEGHRGASGEEWMSKRNQLCENGFSFEYSATFGQAIQAAAGNDQAPKGNSPPSKRYQLIQQYSRCILFDYSYKYFHEDGYGKEYQILNLREEKQAAQRQLYLTACLLTFYQQKRLFTDPVQNPKSYLLADPLWIFVGGKVTAKNDANPDTVGDIEAILRFLARFLANRGESIKFLELLLTQQDELRDEHNRPIFAGQLTYLQSQWLTTQASDLFHDLLQVVFHASAPGLLHVVHLKGSGGEIGLRVGENDRYFGVINVGDAAKLIGQLKEGLDKDSNMIVTDQSYSASLFDGINKPNSSINLLVGAKKFTEGWSSWRVSTMGLMNVGRSEGSEIIQLFGRGVRIKGHGFTLKRSAKLPGFKHPKHLELLETLNVFGIRSDYMKEFQAYLEAEDIGESSTEQIILPVLKEIIRERMTRDDLKMIRPSKDCPSLKSQRPRLELPPKGMGRITLDWYPKIQAKRSAGFKAGSANTDLHEGTLSRQHRAFFDHEALYFALTQYKNEKAWYHLQIDRPIIAALLEKSDWYRLFIPADELEMSDFARIATWQDIALALLKKYTERYLVFLKAKNEAGYLEYYTLQETDDNFIEAYRATVDRSAEDWIQKLTELKNKLENGQFKEQFKFGELLAFDFSRHLYEPLIYLGHNDVVQLSPVSLNEGERDFVLDLKKHFQKEKPWFADKELFLLRNQSRGKGVGFFDEGHFFPDFILWLIHGQQQYISFVDPKGLGRVHGFSDTKIKFSKTIKAIEQRLADPSVILNAFIVSNTPRAEVAWWQHGAAPEQDFNNHHVLFQKDDKDTYIEALFRAVVGG